MMRKRQQNAGRVEPVKETYYILDRAAEQIAGQNVTQAHRQNGMQLTAEQAAMYIASGTIGTENPKESESAQDAVRLAAGRAPQHDEDGAKKGGKR